MSTSQSNGEVQGRQEISNDSLGSNQHGIMSYAVSLRLQQLADHIRQDFALLKEYEDDLRYEDDPRRRVRYRRAIEQLGESAAGYQLEYDELYAQIIDGEPLPGVEEVLAQLLQMRSKLDDLLAGQTVIREDLSSLRQDVLARFDASERTIVATIVAQLDQNQLAMVLAVLDAVETESFRSEELQETLEAAQTLLVEIQQRGISIGDPAITNDVETLSNMVAAPHLDVKHKLKIAVPIIPLFLSYEGVVDLNSGLNLENAWQRLVALVSGRNS